MMTIDGIGRRGMVHGFSCATLLRAWDATCITLQRHMSAVPAFLNLKHRALCIPPSCSPSTNYNIILRQPTGAQRPMRISYDTIQVNLAQRREYEQERLSGERIFIFSWPSALLSSTDVFLVYIRHMSSTIWLHPSFQSKTASSNIPSLC